MDTITQGLLGAVTAQLGFRQRIGRDATWVAAGAAIIPDLDILIQPLTTLSGTENDELVRFVYHRGLSHSLLLVPVLALVVTFIWWNIRRALKYHAGFGLLFGCVFAALLSHPLLDWCTSYGTLLFAPFSTRRFALDAVPIIDVIYTPILILTLTLCYAVRKAPLGRARTTLKIGWIGFSLSLAYLTAGYLMHNRAISALKEFSQKQGGKNSAQYDAYPQIGTIFLWRITRRDNISWTTARINLLHNSTLDTLHVNHTRIRENPWIHRALQVSEIQTFQWFAMDQIRAVYQRQDGNHVVDFHDMRYGREPDSLESLWSARVTLDHYGQVLRVERVHHYRGMRLGQVARRLWNEMWQP